MQSLDSPHFASPPATPTLFAGFKTALGAPNITRPVRPGNVCQFILSEGLSGIAGDGEPGLAGKVQHTLQRLDRPGHQRRVKDRKSTRLNSSHVRISYAVF